MRRLINTSPDTLDLPAYRLLAGGDTLPLAGSLPPGGRVIVGNAQSAAEFLQITKLDPAWQDSFTSTLLCGAQCGGLLLPALRLPDRGGIVSVLHETGTLVDAIPYGGFYGLSAENPYLYDTLQAGRSLKTVRRESYSSGPSTGGEVAHDEVTTGGINPGIEPKPSFKPASGRYELNRGRKVYELKNHPSTSLRCSGQALGMCWRSSPM